MQPVIGYRSNPSRQDAKKLIADSLVWDNHGCLPLRPGDYRFLPELTRYRAAGVDVAFINVGFGEQGVEEHVRMLAHLRHWLTQRPQEFRIISTVDDIHLARASSQLAVGFDIEGANAVDDQVSLVQLYYDLGVRWMLLAYNRNNKVGGGCHDVDNGLTSYGREVLREMKRTGMVPCCSHTGYRTAREVLDFFDGPVIFSHSNARAVHDHPRNIPDDLVRACARAGGVVGLNGLSLFLGGHNTTDMLLRHLDHMVQLVGPDHVGLGLDYVFDTQELDGFVAAMKGTFPAKLGYDGMISMVAPECLPDIVTGMLGLGYDIGAVSKILGGNLLRVAEQSWRPTA